MQERIGNWIWTSALLLAACGSADGATSLVKSRAALTPPATSTTSATFTPPGGERTCRSDADCAVAEQCDSGHGRYYCVPQHEHKDYYGSDAGAPAEHASGDAGPYHRGQGGECEDDEEHRGGEYSDDGQPGGEYSDDGDHDRDGDYDEHSGSNRGPH